MKSAVCPAKLLLYICMCDYDKCMAQQKKSGDLAHIFTKLRLF